MSRTLERIALVVVGAALAVAGDRLLLSDGGSDPSGGSADPARHEALQARQLALAEDRMRTDLRLALVGFFRLVDFRDFARKGEEVTLLVPVAAAADRREVMAGGGARGVRVPRILIDRQARQEWAELGRKLEGLDDGVDERVYAAFEDVRAFVGERPLPQGTDLASVARSEWSGSAVVDRWLALNRTLASRVVAVLSQLDAGP